MVLIAPLIAALAALFLAYAVLRGALGLVGLAFRVAPLIVLCAIVVAVIVLAGR